ncbi:MAG: DNA mismatch repair endonuclease MutL, partial [Lachnospiraceae bacterium]
TAFVRHATSKITAVEDLMSIHTLGFRGEALASIAAVSQVECFTQTDYALSGVHYQIDGGKQVSNISTGCPIGTTFIIRNLFYNTPARRKFLKTPATEGAHIQSLLERLALSNPDISFRFIVNGQNKLFTSGNGNQKEIIYSIYGREIAASILPVDIKTERIHIHGFVGKPFLSRGNRTYENYFVNGRYIKSGLISGAIEEAYKGFQMVHKYPFTVLDIEVAPELLDVNVHPTKMELRFRNGEELYSLLTESIRNTIRSGDLIPQVQESEKEKKSVIPEFMKQAKKIPEPFEYSRRKEWNKSLVKEQEHHYQTVPSPEMPEQSHPAIRQTPEQPTFSVPQKPVQTTFFDTENRIKPKHRIIGQVFGTYWLIELDDIMYIMDQHAAHEKVMYERLMADFQKKEVYGQQVAPPIVLTLNESERQILDEYHDFFESFGFQYDEFGPNDIAIRQVPANLYGINERDLLIALLDECVEYKTSLTPDIISEKIASMSCKAAVKGNHLMNEREVRALIDQIFELDNPYNCPHGRPTMIAFTETEIEKKFKRIQS